MAIQVVDIVGARTVGNSVTQARVAVGLDVVMMDISDAAMQKGIATVAGSLDRFIKKEKPTGADEAAVFAHIQGPTSYDDLKRADLVIETTARGFDLKAETLKQLEAAVVPHAIAASNTSSISITKLAAVLQDASRFIGMHFFNPVSMMTLMEATHDLQANDATHTAVETLTRQLGKAPVAVKNSSGFVVNRTLCPMVSGASCMLDEGLAPSKEADEGMKLDCSHPIGPLASTDMIGLDTMPAVMEVLYTEFSDPKYRPAMLMCEMVAVDCLGHKTGHGVYDYRE